MTNVKFAALLFLLGLIGVALFIIWLAGVVF